MPTYTEYKTSYSGSDIHVAMLDSNGKFVPCGDMQTITVSEHTDRGVVRRLGRRGYAGYTNGPRTVAGTMIFTVLGDSPLGKILMDPSSPTKYKKFSQLPPVDFVISLSSEYNGSTFSNSFTSDKLQSAILGVIFSDTGVIYSIEDVKIELTAAYTAYDYYPLMPANSFNFNTVYEDIARTVDTDLEQVLNMLVG